MLSLEAIVWGHAMRKKIVGSGAILALAITSVMLLASPGETSAFATETIPGESETATAYELEVDDPTGGPVTLDDLQSVAEDFGGTVRAVTYSGESGSGRLTPAPGESAQALAERAADMFADAGTVAPPISGALIDTASPVPEAASARGLDVTASELGGPTAHRADRSATATDQLDAANVTVVNDWPSYFPSDWRAEGYNGLRCTRFVNNTCQSRIQVAKLIQSVSWMDDHTPASWPSQDWGLEFGVALYNPNRCPNDNTVNYGQKWWLNAQYTVVDGYPEWTSNLPGIADAYLDDNRLFDPCSTLSHELGVRYPGYLTAGASYIFTVSSPRYTPNPTSTFSAAFQAVHDDCFGDWANRTDCMGLFNIAWPYSGAQSATVVNATRNLSFPNCVRMHDKWAAPLTFANGTSRLMPAPLSYYDTCFSNDW